MQKSLKISNNFFVWTWFSKMWQSQKRNHIRYINVFGFFFHMTYIFFCISCLPHFQKSYPILFFRDIRGKYENLYYSFKLVIWHLKNNKWHPFLYVFRAKESAEIIIILIKGQLFTTKVTQRSFKVLFANIYGVNSFFLVFWEIKN